MEFEKSAPVMLDKTQTMEEICEFLLENPKTQFSAISESIKSHLYARGVIGKQIKSHGGGVMTYEIDMHHDDYLLINECIYDLLYKRVITPGVNAHNLDLPFVHVSDLEKLKQYMYK